MVLETFQATNLKQGSADGCEETGFFKFLSQICREMIVG